MKKSWVTDARAVVKACTRIPNCPLKKFLIRENTFSFTIDDEGINMNVSIHVGEDYPLSSVVKLDFITQHINETIDVFAGKLAKQYACVLYETSTAEISSHAAAPTISSEIVFSPAPQLINIEERYLISMNEKIGTGGFGDVYKGLDTEKNVKVAVKINHRDTHFLETEAHILWTLTKNGVKGVPQCYWKGYSNGKYCLVMELLGENISHFNLTHRDVLMIALKLLATVEKIHKSGYLHLDIKDLNIIIGKDNPNAIYLCDFGLSIPFIDATTSKHIRQGSYQGFRGTTYYASPHIQQNETPGRRDDMLNLGYVILHMLGKLPWRKYKSNSEAIIYMKTHLSTSALCDGLPKEFKVYFDHCNALAFDEQPTYALLRGLFKRLIKHNNFNTNLGFSWVDTKSPRNNMSI